MKITAAVTKEVGASFSLEELELAMELGATHTVNAKECPETAKKIKHITGSGTHCAVDATSYGPSVRGAWGERGRL